MRALEEGLWVYRHYFLRRWRRSLLAKAACFPELYDFGDLRRFPTLTATTEFFATRYASFPDLDAYLNGYAITGDALARLTVPAHLIAAADDPVIPIDGSTGSRGHAGADDRRVAARRPLRVPRRLSLAQLARSSRARGARTLLVTRPRLAASLGRSSAARRSSP